jgi:DNA-binding transcriptional LysR family regulator
MHLRVCRERGGFEPDIRFHSDDLAIQLEMVRTTGASGLLPDLVLARGIEGIAAPLAAGGGIGREIFTVARRARTPAVDVVLAALSASRRDRPARRRGPRATGAAAG